MRKFGLLFVLIFGWTSWAWGDCRPLDYYTRSVKLYMNPPQGKPDLKAAEKLLSEAIECYPKDGEVQYTAGLLFSKKGEFAKMTEALNAAIQYSPDYRPKAETLKAFVFQETFNTGNTYLEQAQKAALDKKEAEKVKNLREAMTLYQGCMIIDSTMPDLYKNISYAYYLLGIPDSSKLYDGLAYKFAPDSLSAKWGYAYAIDWVNEGKYPQAIEILEKVVKRDSAFWEAWGLLGQLYEAENRIPQMAEVYQRLSRQFPDSADFLKQLAIYELRSGLNSKAPAEAKKHYQEADTLFALYLPKNSADSNAWYNRGLTLISLQDYKKAAEVLKGATDKFPGYADAWQELSGAYARLGNRALEAKKAYNTAKKLRGEKEE